MTVLLLRTVAVLVASAQQVTIDPDAGTEVPLHDDDMNDYEYDEQPFVTDAKRTAAGFGVNKDGLGWTEIGAGYCFPTSAHEKKYRIGSWRRGALNVAKSSCERIKDCVGVHVHTKDKKFVLLSKTGAPGGQDIGDRECHTYARPPIGIELDCQPRGMVRCLNEGTISTPEEAAKVDWFIKFHSPQCKHCNEFFPTFKKIATSSSSGLKTKFGFGGVDCENYLHQGVCDALGVTSLPTLALFRNGEYYVYEGPREQDDIEDWLEEWWDGEMDGMVKGRAIPKEEAKSKTKKKNDTLKKVKRRVTTGKKTKKTRLRSDEL